MKTRTHALALSALCLALAFACGGVWAADDVKSFCLSCHGPLTKFVADSAAKKAAEGKPSPHQYIPHTSTDPKEFPDCDVCHEPHPAPPPAGYKDSGANTDACWACHHNFTLQRCSNCHK